MNPEFLALLTIRNLAALYRVHGVNEPSVWLNEAAHLIEAGLSVEQIRHVAAQRMHPSAWAIECVAMIYEEKLAAHRAAIATAATKRNNAA